MYRKLQNLSGNGFGVTVIVPFTVEMGNVSVEVTAQFKEEVLLKQSISTKRHKIGFLKYDYSLNASFEVGNYTGVNFKAVVHTENEKESDAALGKRLEPRWWSCWSSSPMVRTPPPPAWRALRPRTRT